MENNEAEKFITKIINNLKNKSFVIFYFLILYTISVVIVGKMRPTYVIITTIMTVLFSNQYEKLNTPKEIASLFIFQDIMVLLAFIARMNIITCIILNLIVPYIVIILKSSQYNKMGYYVHLMSFTYFQIMPRNFDLTNFDFNYLYLLIAGHLLFILLKVLSLLFKKTEDVYELEKSGLDLIAKLILKPDQEKSKELERISKEILFNLASRSDNKITREKYLYATFFEKYARISSIDPEQVNDLDLKMELETIANFFRKVSLLNLENKKTLKAIYTEFAILVNKKLESYLIIKNYKQWLKIYEEILKVKMNKKKEIAYDTPYLKKLKYKITDNVKFNSYTFRFGLQMSLTVTIGAVIANFAGLERGLWIAITMFLFLRPTIEESRLRMKNRIIGTLIGSIITSFLYSININDYQLEAIIISGLVGIFIFTLTPGTIFQAIMVTIYSLILTSLRIPEGQGIEPFDLIMIRIAYTIFSALLVFIINTTIFPPTNKTEFKYNKTLINILLEQYLKLINNAMYMKISNYELKDLKIRYISATKMLSETKIKTKEQIDLKTQILKYDELVFLAEQVIYELSFKKITLKEKEVVYNFSKYAKTKLKESINNKQKIKTRPVINTNNNNLNEHLENYLNNLDYLMNKEVL